MAKGQASVSVTVDDLASSVLRKINAGLKDVNNSTANLAKTSKNLGGADAFGFLKSGLSGVTRAAEKTVGALAALAPPIALITGALSLAGLSALVSNFATLGAQTAQTAKRIGIGTNELTKFDNAATLAGASAGTGAQAMESFAKNLNDAKFGRNTTFATALMKLGVNFNSAEFKAKSLTEQMAEYNEALRKIQSPQARLTAATYAYDGAASGMLVVISKTREEMNKYFAESVSHGAMTQEQADRGQVLATKFEGLRQSVSGLSTTVGDKLAPAFGQLSDWLSKIIDANREWIGQKVGEYAKRFADAMEGANWKAIGESFAEIGTGIKTIVGHMGGWQTASEILIGLWIGSKVVSFIANLTSIAGLFSKILNIPGAIALLGYMGFKGASQSGTEIGKEAERGRTPTGIDEWGNATGFRDGNSSSTPYVPIWDRLKSVVQGHGWYGPEHARQTDAANFDTNIDPNAKGLLNTIMTRESGGDYSVLYGGKPGNPNTPHMKNWDNVPAPSSVGPDGRPTSAWGGFQFENGTWAALAGKLGLTDKSPANQNRAAWVDAQQRYMRESGRNLSDDLKSTDPLVLAGIRKNLLKEWPSLGNMSASQFVKELQENTSKAGQPTNAIAPPVPFTGPAINMDPATQRTLSPANSNINLNLSGTLPPGMAATVDGGGVNINNNLQGAPALQFGGF